MASELWRKFTSAMQGVEIAKIDCVSANCDGPLVFISSIVVLQYNRSTPQNVVDTKAKRSSERELHILLVVAVLNTPHPVAYCFE